MRLCLCLALESGENGYKESCIWYFCDLCFKLALCCGCQMNLSSRIALTKPWLELRFDQEFEEKQGLIAVEHHGGHHRRLHRGQ